MFTDSNSRQAAGKHLLFLAGEGKDDVEVIYLINCLLWASFVLDGLSLWTPLIVTAFWGLIPILEMTKSERATLAVAFWSFCCFRVVLLALTSNHLLYNSLKDFSFRKFVPVLSRVLATACWKALHLFLFASIHSFLHSLIQKVLVMGHDTLFFSPIKISFHYNLKEKNINFSNYSYQNVI